MSDPLATNLLGLPYLAAAQAQKHVTHNEALRSLDALVQLAVADATLTDPPGSPAEGDRYIVPAAAAGAWAGHETDIAAFVDGAWAFFTPLAGWLAFDAGSSSVLVFDGSGWESVGGFLGVIEQLGINAVADATNRLAVGSNAVLFAGIEAGDGGTGDIRFVVNKETDGDTASLLFQSGFSGRAEVGLAGDTDLVFKVSPNGADWVEAIRIDKETGLPAILYDNAVSGLTAETVQDAIDELEAGKQAALGFVPREVLAANRTYYVRTDGSDGNNGLTDSSGGAFASIAKAVAVVSALDLSIYSVTIQIRDGTYSEGVITLGQLIGSGTVTIRGNTATPANVTLNPTSSYAFLVLANGWTVDSVRFHKASGTAISAFRGYACYATIANCHFGAGFTYAHLLVDALSYFLLSGAIVVSGSCPRFANVSLNGLLSKVSSATVTMSGSPAFSVAFVVATTGGIVSLGGAATVTGAATGKRYDASLNAVITYSSGVASLPGDVAGSTATGGQAA